jgi:FSR family fosmidomycin resistance protein-like MFS transporter
MGRLAVSKQGLRMSVFFVGGTLGHALGPFFAATIFDITGLRGTAWIALAILIAALGLLAKMPFAQASATSASHLALREHGAPSASLRRVLLGGAAALLVVTGVRTWLQSSLATYVPQQLTAFGFAKPGQPRALADAGSRGLDVLIGGPLGDRFGPRSLTTCTLVALAPVLMLFARSTTLSMGQLLRLAGLLVGVPLSMTFVVGQSFLPKSGAGLRVGVRHQFGRGSSRRGTQWIPCQWPWARRGTVGPGSAVAHCCRGWAGSAHGESGRIG